MAAFCWPAGAQVNVLTANYDNARTSANLNESTLNTGNVTLSRFGKVFSRQVDGQIYAQPLYASSLNMPGKGIRNVVFVATMHDSVYAFDADSPWEYAPLWQVSLGTSVPSGEYNFTDIQPEVGILGTPVIDAATNTLYAVANTVTTGAFQYSLHALDLFDGHEKFGAPVAIRGSVSGTGNGSQFGLLAFDPFLHLQRPGLLLLNGTVYVAFGSHADGGQNYHGWIIGYKASNVQRQTAIFSVTPDAAAGSVWQAGRGLAADDAGNIYAVTANGSYDGQTNFGESILKLATSAGSLAVADWFTPDNWSRLNEDDNDVGSSGAILIPGTNFLLSGSKLGLMYLMDRARMGHRQTGDSQILQSFQAVTVGIFNMAIWPRASDTMIYVQGQSQFLQSYRLNGSSIAALPASVSHVPIFLPYQGLALSAHGDDVGSGILWETVSRDDGYLSPGTLHALDARDLTHELWNSSTDETRDGYGYFAKFATPTVANGKVYVPTFSNQLAVYGLFAARSEIAGVVNAASYTPGAVAPGELITVFGHGFGPEALAGLQLDSIGKLARTLDGTRVLFDGAAAPLVYAASGQVSAFVPLRVSGVTQISVESPNRLTDMVTILVTTAAPGLFSLDATGVGPGAFLNQDSSVNSTANPASRGSIVVLYATGAGITTPEGSDGEIVEESVPEAGLPVTVTMDGQPAEVLYAGSAPGMPLGILQINVRVPGGVSTGSVPVAMTVAGNTSQSSVTLAVN